jgi:hypothetical protein
VLPVKFITRGLGLFILSLGIFFMVGCGADNEAEGEKLAKTAGDPGAPDPKAVHPAGALPTTPEEHFQNQQKNDSLKGSKYPGASKQK